MKLAIVVKELKTGTQAIGSIKVIDAETGQEVEHVTDVKLNYPAGGIVTASVEFIVEDLRTLRPSQFDHE